MHILYCTVVQYRSSSGEEQPARERDTKRIT